MIIPDFLTNVSLFKAQLFSGTIHHKTGTILLKIMNYSGIFVKQIRR